MLIMQLEQFGKFWCIDELVTFSLHTNMAQNFSVVLVGSRRSP